MNLSRQKRIIAAVTITLPLAAAAVFALCAPKPAFARPIPNCEFASQYYSEGAEVNCTWYDRNGNPHQGSQTCQANGTWSQCE